MIFYDSHNIIVYNLTQVCNLSNQPLNKVKHLGPSSMVKYTYVWSLPPPPPSLPPSLYHVCCVSGVYIPVKVIEDIWQKEVE